MKEIWLFVQPLFLFFVAVIFVDCLPLCFCCYYYYYFYFIIIIIILYLLLIAFKLALVAVVLFLLHFFVCFVFLSILLSLADVNDMSESQVYVWPNVLE